MTRRQIRRNETLYTWLVRSLDRHGLTLTSKNLTSQEYRILRNYYEKYTKKMIKAGLIAGWNS